VLLLSRNAAQVVPDTAPAWFPLCVKVEQPASDTSHLAPCRQQPRQLKQYEQSSQVCARHFLAAVGRPLTGKVVLWAQADGCVNQRFFGSCTRTWVCVVTSVWSPCLAPAQQHALLVPRCSHRVLRLALHIACVACRLVCKVCFAGRRLQPAVAVSTQLPDLCGPRQQPNDGLEQLAATVRVQTVYTSTAVTVDSQGPERERGRATLRLATLGLGAWRVG
jgi:hypothetical protein